MIFAFLCCSCFPVTIEKHKDKLAFKEPENAWNYETLKVPCGKCISCQMSRAGEWATRATQESKYHLHNCFVTLTYAPEHLPENESLNKEDLRLFFKRVRTKFKGVKFKYLASGEYGHNPKDNKIERPHYHICFFGIDFADKYVFYLNKIGQRVFRSKTLEDLWPFGHSTIGEFTYETAAYTARS